MELRWDEPSDSLISGFIVTYGPLGRSSRKSDLLDRQKSSHVMRGLVPGLLYNISTFSTKRNTNSNDISQPATALIRTSEQTLSLLEGLWKVCESLNACVYEFSCKYVCLHAGPRRVEQLQVVNVSSSQVWLSWLVQAARHAAVSRLHVSLLPSDGGEARTAVLNTSVTEFSFRSGSALQHSRTLKTQISLYV